MSVSKKLLTANKKPTGLLTEIGSFTYQTYAVPTKLVMLSDGVTLACNQIVSLRFFDTSIIYSVKYRSTATFASATRSMCMYNDIIYGSGSTYNEIVKLDCTEYPTTVRTVYNDTVYTASPYGVSPIGDYGHIIFYGSNSDIIGVLNSSDMTLVSSISDTATCYGFIKLNNSNNVIGAFVTGTRLYSIDSSGVLTLNSTTTGNFSSVSNNGAMCVTSNDSHYISTSVNYLRIYTITNSNTLTIVSSTLDTTLNSDFNVLYSIELITDDVLAMAVTITSTGNSALALVDISNKATPSVIGFIEFDYANSVVPAGLYVDKDRSCIFVWLDDNTSNAAILKTVYYNLP